MRNKIKNNEELKIIYNYVEPQNEADKKEQQRALGNVYFKLFDMVLEEKKAKKNLKK